MPFQKYRPAKQWGKDNTRYYKSLYNKKLKERMPVFKIPEVLQKLGVKIFDPNDADFPRAKPKAGTTLDHPAFRVPSVEEHPLYKPVKCDLFDGTIPFTDGIDQACALTKAVKRTEFPKTILEKAMKIARPSNLDEKLSELILRGERYDPTLEKLPRRFDPILFWFPHPRMHGTPILKRSNIILENLYRKIVLSALQIDHLNNLRHDLDESLSCALNIKGISNPFVISIKPHIVVQSPLPIEPWANREVVEATRQEKVVDVAPIDPRIDLSANHIYNESLVLPRMTFPLHLDVLMWAREQDQKYPWTREQNAANAIMYCFGAAVSEAVRQNLGKELILKKPVVTRGVQLVKGMMDFVVFQLNTLDIGTRDDGPKNIVWIEHAQRLYKPGPYYENYDTVIDLNVETFHKMTGLLLTR